MKLRYDIVSRFQYSGEGKQQPVRLELRTDFVAEHRISIWRDAISIGTWSPRTGLVLRGAAETSFEESEGGYSKAYCLALACFRLFVDGQRLLEPESHWRVPHPGEEWATTDNLADAGELVS